MPDSWEYVRASCATSSVSYMFLDVQDVSREPTVLRDDSKVYAIERDKRADSNLTNSHFSVHGTQPSIVFLSL